MKSIHSYFLVFLFIITSYTITAQEPKELFRSDEILKFTLVFDNKEVLNDIEIRDEHPAELIHKLIDGTSFTHNLKISVRGKSRTKICKFPPLKLNFKKKATTNTVFSKQDKLKLVTHCNSSDANENYLYREYLAYKLYNIITPVSINVRLCDITYEDKSDKKKTTIKKGILLEDVEDVGKRNGLLEYKKDLRNQESLEQTNLDNIIFFQYLIGNLDWSIARRHNVKILKDDSNGLPMAVPYDFDYSGFVDTPYAVVPEGFDVSNVRTRIFRGFCRNDNYQERVDFYNSKKEQFYQVINEATFLETKDREDTIKYIDKFYEVLNDRKQFYKKVVTACTALHDHVYQEWDD